MPRGKSTVEYVVISDLTKPVDEQEGYVLVVEGRGGYTDKNRQKALELALRKYEEEEFPVDEFPDGIALRKYIRTMFECGIDTIATAIKFIPSLPHPVFQHKPPMLNGV